MGNGALPASALGSLSAALPYFRACSETVLELREIAHRLVEVARPQPGSALDAVLAAFHADELPHTGESASAGALSLLGIGPGRWMLVEHAVPLRSQGPLERLTDAFEIVIEIGDAWTQIAVSGTAMHDLLAKGCALDLHPTVFREGACAVTGFAHLRCLLFRFGAGFRLFVGRSYAASLAEWLIEAAAEFGLASSDKAPREAPISETRPCNHAT
jgi:heterotetrameric sarcosine oxidase gamma subunit